MEITTYDQAIEYLETFIKPVVFAKIRPEDARLKDPLDRMRKLLELVGNPQDGFRSILVGGTSGKGSTSYFISHILTSAGYKTGLTISPHLQKINERLQIDGVEISDEEFVRLLNEIIPAIEQMRKAEISHFVRNDNRVVSEVGEPSHFEILIAMAFRYFAMHKVDIAVVEVGLGGRYDATNVLNPLIAVLTNVSLDHTAILGNTVEKIAREKAGIIKKDQKSKIKNQKILTITGVRQKSVVKIVEERCKKVGAKLYRLGEDFNYEVIDENVTGSNFNFKNLEYIQNIHLSVIGEYQVENASLAIRTVLELKMLGFKISEQNIRTALSTSFFPGRFEIINLNNKSAGCLSHVTSEKSPLTQNNFALCTLNFELILDGAHNLAKMKAFISSLKKVYPSKFKGMDSRTPRVLASPKRRLHPKGTSFPEAARGNDRGFRKIFIVAFKDDKDARGMLKEILKVADTLIITEFHKTIEVKGHGSTKISNFKFLISNLKRKNVRTYYTNSSREALGKAIEMLNHSRSTCYKVAAQVQHDNYKANLIVVTGSLYLVGEVRDFISKL